MTIFPTVRSKLRGKLRINFLEYKELVHNSCLALTLVTYSISANLKAMPRLLKSTETSAQVSPKGARRSSPPSVSIP